MELRLGRGFHVPEAHHCGRYALRQIKRRRRNLAMVFFFISGAKCRSSSSTSHQVTVILKLAPFFTPTYICWRLEWFLLQFHLLLGFCLPSVCVFASETKSCRPVGSRRCVNGFTTPSLLNAMSSSLFSPGHSLSLTQSVQVWF